ncbi:unnamed protein product [Ambrosiozyma monospora]|uniref:Unnamed protein product n=1 Tax=Ambrosiozyma monospora TaxID=43982 RepID=A0A9W6YQT0_AMBMO|nr:unnamed protein product [Ambrosiozyma monospora]
MFASQIRNQSLIAFIRPGIKSLLRNKPQQCITTTSLRFFRTSFTPLYGLKLGEDQERYKIPNQEEQHEPVHYRTHGTLFYNLRLPQHLRLANEPMYFNPLSNYVIGMKRFAIGFGVIGLMFSYLMSQTGLIWDEVSSVLAFISCLPFPAINYLYRPFVSRVYRVYDTTKPQTLDTLTDKEHEKLIMEKINWSGFKSFNELIDVDSLKVPVTGEEQRFGYVNLISKNKDGLVKYFYINDGFTNIRMDRIMSLAKSKSGVDDGTVFFKK